MKKRYFLLPDIIIPTGKEILEMSAEEQKFWVKDVLSMRYRNAWDDYEKNTGISHQRYEEIMSYLIEKYVG